MTSIIWYIYNEVIKKERELQEKVRKKERERQERIRNIGKDPGSSDDNK
jgi:heme exporter protein D